MIYTELKETLMPNTKMVQCADDNGTVKLFRIYPIDGYALHDNLRDWEEINPETNETTLHKGYTEIMASCGADYDFESNPREFYTALKDTEKGV